MTTFAPFTEISETDAAKLNGGVIVIPVIMCLQWAAGAAVLGGTVGYQLVQEYYEERCN